MASLTSLTADSCQSSFPSRPFKKRSFSTGTTSSSAEWTLESLDAHRQRQAETGQLLPRTPRGRPVPGAVPNLTRTESHPSRLCHSARSGEKSRAAPGNRKLSLDEPSSGVLPPCSTTTCDRPKREHSRSQNRPADTYSQMTEHSIGLTGASHINTKTRRINSGFEVLPFGTLGDTQPVHDWEDPEATMPRRRSSESKRNKLQKRRRSDSQTRD